MFKNTADSLSICLRKSNPRSSRSRTSRRALSCLALFSLCAATSIASPAQTFRTLVTFPGPNNGSGPNEPLIQGTDGRFYGTTSYGAGTIFKVTAGGTLTNLYSFCSQPKCADGSLPTGALVQAADGDFYGTTRGGGSANGNNEIPQGTVFKISTEGVFTSLHTFIGSDGAEPNGGLVQGSDGDLYGTTTAGGGDKSVGTIFKIASTGALTTLYAFPSTGSQGRRPSGALVQGSNGNFYGDTSSGGGTGCTNNEGCGTVFEVTPSGTVTTLAILEEPDGQPLSSLALGTNGNLYGTATAPQVGAVFEVTPEGALSTIYTFEGGSGGENPEGGLVLGTDGNFYGTTAAGGRHCGNFPNESCGTVFELSPSGTLTSLHIFTGTTDGSNPTTTLMQSTNGTFYGLTSTTIFSVSTGLGPFVIPQPTLGAVGKKVTILGTNLNGTSAVSFNGTAATFTASGSAINTTVPAGATTGTVTVTTSSGTLSSNVVFTVTD